MALVVTPVASRCSAAGIGFEKKEGFLPDGDIAASAGWTGSTIGAARISAMNSKHGRQSLEILSSDKDQAAIKSLSIPTDGILFIDFSIKPVADSAAAPLSTVDANGAILGFLKKVDHGTVVTIREGQGAESNTVETGYRFAIDDQNVAADWMEVTIREDMNSRKWDLFLDGKLTLIDQPLSTTSSKTPPSIAIYSSGTASTFVDDLLVAGENPLFKDSDKDGIPDAVEMANGTNAFYDDRNGDLNGDGVSNIASYMQGRSIGTQQSLGRKIIYVDNRNGSDALSGELSYRSVKEGPKATLKAAILAADANTAIAVLPGNQPYTLIERAKGTAETINIIPLGDITLKSSE